MTPQVTFYTLPTAAAEPITLPICQLIEHLFRDCCFSPAQPIYVHSACEQTAQQLDEHLWSFRQESFLPHSLVNHDLQPQPPILIGHGDIAAHHHGILINLAAEVPKEFQQFTTIWETVPTDPQQKILARQRYRLYRNAGCQLHHANNL